MTTFNNINFKSIGLIFFIYITFTVIMINYGLYKQLGMITILILFYIYYNKYYTSIPDLINNIKNINTSTLETIITTPLNSNIHSDYNNAKNNINDIGNINDTDNYTDNYTDNAVKIKTRKIISEIPISGKINTYFENNIIPFIDEYIPINIHQYLQVKSDNTNALYKSELKLLINNYIILLHEIILKDDESLNYYQQIKNIENIILNKLHSVIFINNKSHDIVNNIISELKAIFYNIQIELETKINKKTITRNKEYIPSVNEIPASNTNNYMI